MPATPSMPHWHLNDYEPSQLEDIWQRISFLVGAGVGYQLHYCTDIPTRVRITNEIREALFTIEQRTANPLLPNPYLSEDQLRAFEVWMGAKT